MPRYKEPSQKQLDFVRWYTSPASPTYDNAMQSAIRAGFSESYSKSHASRTLVPIAKRLVTDKVAEKIDKVVDRSAFYSELLQDAENGIAKRVRMDTKDDTKLTAIQQKDQHFTAERLGKDSWSTKTITENHGLISLTPDTLVKIADTLTDTLTAPQNDMIEADYTVKSDELIAERAKEDNGGIE